MTCSFAVVMGNASTGVFAHAVLLYMQIVPLSRESDFFRVANFSCRILLTETANHSIMVVKIIPRRFS
jgi:hypothetical protein